MSPNPYAAPESPPAAPLPKPAVAESLDAAGVDKLVLVDGQGRVRGRWYRRATYGLLVLFACVLGWVAIGIMSRVTGRLDAYAFAPLLGSIVGVVLVLVRNRSGAQTALLIQSERLDEAEDRLRRTLANRFVAGLHRSVAHVNLAVVHHRRGHQTAALEELAVARRRLDRWPWRKTLQARSAAALEVEILLAADRVDDAARVFEEVRRLPPGEYYALLRDTLGLLLDFHRGATTLDLAAVRANVAKAKASPHRVLLAALCAWALDRHGLGEEATALAAEALASKAPLRLDRVAPRVHAWLVARASS